VSTTAIDPTSVQPELTPAQRVELNGIGYLLNELAALHARGLLTDEALAVVTAEKEARRTEIERTGRAEAARKQARALLRGQPARALAWATLAREAAPEVLEGWTLGIDALGRLGDHDGAIRLCQQGADAHGHAVLRDRAAAIDAERLRNERLLAIARDLMAARAALLERRPADAVAFCERILARDPGHLEAMVLAIDALERLGRADEAASRIADLMRAHPTEQPVRWAARLARLQARRDKVAKKPDALPELAGTGQPDQTPPLQWRSVVTEFFLEHWQKLILGLALLLIVVSSTVGASILLGERLWSPEGKCLLALAYTLVVASAGSGLGRWGARRAGQLLCLATVLSLPIHFTLIGEQSGAPGLNGIRVAVLVFDAVVLVVVGARLGRALLPAATQTAIPAFLVMAVLNAVASQVTPAAWGYGLLLLASGLFLLGVEGESLGEARRVKGQQPAVSVLPSVLGLLTFAFLWTSVRLGAYLLRLPANLYAVPVMLAASAALRAADALRAAGPAPDRARVATLLRSAGLGLSALAVALALGRPPSPPWTDAANLVVTALLGMALYADRLRRERQPAYLYAAFAALALTVFATRELFGAQVAALELLAGRWLGYAGPLPQAFRALNGLALNALLIVAAVVLERRLASPRLAWHCHAIGLPLAVGACLFATAEPLAGLVTMSGYAVLYAIAARLFHAPALLYLVCAAGAGAGVEAAIRLGASTGSELALVVTGIAAAYWAIGRMHSMRGATETDTRPIGHSGLVASVVALAVATAAALPPDPIAWATVAPFAGLALLYAWIGRVVRHAGIAHLATGCAAVALALAGRVMLAAPGRPSPELWLALWITAESAGFALTSLAAGRRRTQDLQPNGTTFYAQPLLRTALLLAGLGTSLVLAGLAMGSRLPTAAEVALAASALEMAALTWCIAVQRVRWPEAPAWLGVFTACAGLLAGGLAVGLWSGFTLGWPLLAVASGWVAFAAALAGDFLRTRDMFPATAFRAPLLAAVGLGVVLAIGFGIGAWDSPGMLAAGLAGATLALTLATRQTPNEAVAYTAAATGLAAWLCAWAALAEGRLEVAPNVGVRTQLYLIALNLVGIAIPRRRDGSDPSRPSLRRAFRHALPDVLPVASLLGLACSLSVWPPADLGPITANVALGALVLSMTARLRRELPWAHAALGLAWLAALSACLDLLGVPGVERQPSLIAGWLACTTSLVALLLGLLYTIGRRLRASRLWINAARDLADVTALSTLGLATAARLLSPDVFPTALAALLIVTLPIVLIAAGERTSWRVFGAIGALVGAAYLVLFELGRGRPGDPSALGVLATSLALAFWTLERLFWLRGAERWRAVFAGPLRISVATLAVAALPADWGAPRALLLAALPFLLLIKTWPAAQWLHAALGIVSAALAFAVLQGPGLGALAATAVAWAFVCWALGMAIRRFKTPLCDVLGLPRLDLDRPAFDVALLAGLSAIALRIDGLARLGQHWSDDAWLPLALAVLAALLLATAFAERVLADAAVALASFGVLALLAPWLTTAETWLIAGLALAIGWELSRRGLGPSLAWKPLQQFSGLNLLPGALWDWSRGFGILAALPLAGIVAIEVLATLPGLATIPRLPILANWAHVLVGLALLAPWVVLAGLDLGPPWSRLATHGALLLIVWWLGVPGSPIVGRAGLTATVWLPLATMAYAAALAWWTARRAALSGVDLEVAGARWVFRVVDAPLWLVVLLSVVAAVLTGARVQWSTPATLLLGVAALALLSETVLQPVVVRMAALFWLAAWSFVGAQAARHFQVETPPAIATYIAAGLLFGAATLAELSGRLRRREAALAALLEPFAIAAAWGVAGLMAAALSAPAADARQALVAIAVLVGLGALFATLALRNGSTVLAHAAQGAVLATYVAYRRGWPLPIGSDAVVLLILAALDLGLAEVFERLGLRLFARPAIGAAVLLPAVSLGLALGSGPLSDETQFLLGATAAFYALAGVRLRHRGPAYAAALLGNAFLWVLWYRSGWQLARDPQFYLIPAGLTAILFAESHRRVLGRHWLNAVRGVGLGLIYVSLAVPIGQVESLGAWVALLLLSLLGIFVGIGLRAQVFLWLGLASFLLSLGYQLGRLGLEHALARWAIMLALGLAMVLFVAFSEKKRLVATMQDYFGRVRHWE
jgi:hypothetical protein